jgi:transposase
VASKWPNLYPRFGSIFADSEPDRRRSKGHIGHFAANEEIEQNKVETNSGLGEAISYMLKRWDKLTLFLRKAGAPVDNNAAELILKRAILHRKNSLFYRNERGSAVGDLYMSLIETCRLCGADPFEYLTILQKHSRQVAERPEEWLPWNYRLALAAADTS